jgi:hypothetical protein
MTAQTIPQPSPAPLSGNWLLSDPANGTSCAMVLKTGLDGRQSSALDPACAASFPEAAGAAGVVPGSSGAVLIDARGRTILSFTPKGRTHYEGVGQAGRVLHLSPL